MFAIERETGLGVVESPGCGIPVEHLEVFSVVIGVAFYACCAGRSGTRIGCVQPFVLLQLSGYFFVTLEAAESWGSGGNLMTLDAVRTAREALVRAGKWPRRYLSICCGGQEEGDDERNCAEEGSEACWQVVAAPDIGEDLCHKSLGGLSHGTDP